VLLARADNGEQLLVAAARRKVEDQLGAVGVHVPGRESVVKADLVVQFLDGGTDALHRHAGLAQRARTNASAKPTNGTVAWRPADGRTVTSGAPSFGRAQGWVESRVWR
jgi:hypothetical protein